jgi:hypothetical protein
MSTEEIRKIRPHTIIALVEDRPGVLNRIASKWRQRGFNIESLAVGHSEVVPPSEHSRAQTSVKPAMWFSAQAPMLNVGWIDGTAQLCLASTTVSPALLTSLLPITMTMPNWFLLFRWESPIAVRRTSARKIAGPPQRALLSLPTNVEMKSFQDQVGFECSMILKRGYEEPASSPNVAEPENGLVGVERYD